jgi:hypothetical protein
MAKKLANRDSRRYEDPEKFNIHRGQHLASDVRQGCNSRVSSPFVDIRGGGTVQTAGSWCR